MLPLLGSLITGGAGLLGSFMSSSSNAANIQMQRETNQMSIAENQKNRDFQEQMSNTAYQRASNDMTRAGLNPAMMFGGGSAASTPGGGVPSLQAPRGDPHAGFANLGRITESAVNSAVTGKTFEKMTEEIAKIKTDAEYVKALSRTEAERPMQVATDVASRSARLPVDVLAGKEAEEIKKLAQDHPVLWKYLQQVPYVVERGSRTVGAAADMAAPFVHGAKSALKYLHEWKGPPAVGLSPSQTRDLYDRFKAMDGR